jgi:hypothetical protein
MNLIDLSCDIFKKELTKVFEREKTEKTYLNAEQFKTCEQRARAGVLEAIDQVIKRIAIDICKHGIQEHERAENEELTHLQTVTNVEYQEVSTRDFWNPG